MSDCAVPSCHWDHLLVRIDDGRLIDIGGARAAAEVTLDGGELLEIDLKDVRALTTDHGWEAPQTDTATLWVEPVLDAVNRRGSHREATCFVHDFELRDRLDIHIEWSKSDTGQRLTAFGRRPGDALGPWMRCAVHSIKEDNDGLRIIDFTPEAFAAHAQRFEDLIRARSEAVEAHFLAAVSTERPVRPPP